MTRRRLFLSFASLLGLTCIGLVVLALLSPRSDVTEAELDRINIGMSIEDVSAVLGRNPDYLKLTSGGFCYVWNNKDTIAVVEFGNDLKVSKTDLMPRPSHIKEAELDRVKVGMSGEDVIAVVGRMPDNGGATLTGSCSIWQNEDGSIAVVEAGNDLKVSKTALMRPPPETVLEKIWRVLHLPD